MESADMPIRQALDLAASAMQARKAVRDELGYPIVAVPPVACRPIFGWAGNCQEKRGKRDFHNNDSHPMRKKEEFVGKSGEFATETLFPSLKVERHYPGGWRSDFGLYEENEVGFDADLAPGVSVKVSIMRRYHWSWLAACADPHVPDEALRRYGRPVPTQWKFPKTPLTPSDIIVLVQFMGMARGGGMFERGSMVFRFVGFVFALDVAGKFVPSMTLEHKFALYMYAESWVDEVIGGRPPEIIASIPIKCDIHPLSELGSLLDKRA